MYYHLIRSLFPLPYITGILISWIQKWNPTHWLHLLNNLLTSVHVVLWDSILCIYSYDSRSLLKLFCCLWTWWFLIPCFTGLKLEIRFQITFITYFKFPDWLYTEYLYLFTDVWEDHRNFMQVWRGEVRFGVWETTRRTPVKTLAAKEN